MCNKYLNIYGFSVILSLLCIIIIMKSKNNSLKCLKYLMNVLNIFNEIFKTFIKIKNIHNEILLDVCFIILKNKKTYIQYYYSLKFYLNIQNFSMLQKYFVTFHVV